jgi:hypothetical protein
MAMVKHVNIEFGNNYIIGNVMMSDNKKIRVIGTLDDEGRRNWISEAQDGNEKLEDMALDMVKACFKGIVDVIAR